MKNMFKIAATSLGLAILSTSALACECDDHVEKRNFYLGVEGGISTALKKQFTHKETKMTGSLKSSPLYGALVGYKYYPGMAVEASWQHKPSYTMKFKLPTFKVGSVDFNKTAGKTKIISDIYMIGLIYDFPEVSKCTPYIGIDGGIARISSKRVSVYKNMTSVGMSSNMEIFRIKKASTISPAAQVTLGISSGEILPNLRVNLSARVQVIKDAKIKYEKLNTATGKWNSAKLKQTLGVGEIVLGLTYDLF